MRTPALITFDAYMALLDIEGSLVPVVIKELGLVPDAATAFVRLWRAKQMECAAISNSLDKERITFAQATELALDYVANRHAVVISPDRRPVLLMAWNALSPWPEADEVVTRLRANGYATAILSNGDQSMLDALAEQFSAGFDHILSSESAGKYKPHPAMYAVPAKMLGVNTRDVLHVAGSANDVLGAVAAGMPCVWSNRHKDVLLDPARRPLAEFDDLRGVIDFCR